MNHTLIWHLFSRRVFVFWCIKVTRSTAFTSRYRDEGITLHTCCEPTQSNIFYHYPETGYRMSPFFANSTGLPNCYRLLLFTVIKITSYCENTLNKERQDHNLIFLKLTENEGFNKICTDAAHLIFLIRTLGITLADKRSGDWTTFLQGTCILQFIAKVLLLFYLLQCTCLYMKIKDQISQEENGMPQKKSYDLLTITGSSIRWTPKLLTYMV